MRTDLTGDGLDDVGITEEFSILAQQLELQSDFRGD